MVTLPGDESPTRWIVFLVFAYFSGHLLFAASTILDPLYDAVKDALRDAGLKAVQAHDAAEKARRAADTGNPSLAVSSGDVANVENAGEPSTAKPAAAREPRLSLTKGAVENHRALDAVKEIRDDLLQPGELGAVNVYQWARAMLTALFPPAAAEVHGLEAESKFFRSLVPVLLLAAGIAGSDGQWVEAGVAIVLAGVSFCRFYGRRLKGTSQAYWYIIALHRAKRLLAPPPPAALEGGGRDE
ncbi:MAG: hypothetical protein JO306_15305 [Gemmatimonadetes bacterium]|nr:hypothetical protein [Gemmatimonadota bacterium]